jgi:hypothetical protein
MPHVLITHDDHISDGVTFTGRASLGDAVTIGEAAYLGQGSTVWEMLSIGAGVDIGMIRSAEGRSRWRDLGSGPSQKDWTGDERMIVDTRGHRLH